MAETKENKGKRRITFQVDVEIRDELDKYIPWGQQRMIFEAITRDLLGMFRNHDPNLVIAAIISEEVMLTDIVDYSKHAKNKAAEDG